ncbi:hypothetical protein ABZU45_01740 [Streptomyces avermitilis]
MSFHKVAPVKKPRKAAPAAPAPKKAQHKPARRQVRRPVGNKSQG